MPDLAVVAAVALGGAVGSVLRYLLGSAVTARWAGDLPLATIAVNLSGSFAIGVLAVLFDEAGWGSPLLRTTLIVGLLGGFTTFSAFSLETLQLWQRGHWPLAGLYVAVSVGGSLLAVALAASLTRNLTQA